MNNLLNEILSFLKRAWEHPKIQKLCLDALSEMLSRIADIALAKFESETEAAK